MQDTFCLSVSSKFSFGATAGKEPERGLQFLTSVSANMKSADEGNFPVLFHALNAALTSPEKLLCERRAPAPLRFQDARTPGCAHAMITGTCALPESLGGYFIDITLD